MRILRARRTAGFVYFFVRCRCGNQFGHRAQKRWIVCYQCGRIVEMARARRAGPRARRTAFAEPRLHTRSSEPRDLGDEAGAGSVMRASASGA